MFAYAPVRLPVLFQGVLIKLQLWIPLALGAPSKTRCSCSSNFVVTTLATFLLDYLLLACRPLSKLAGVGEAALLPCSPLLLWSLSSTTLPRGRQRLWPIFVPLPLVYLQGIYYIVFIFYRIIGLLFQWEHIALLSWNLKCNLITVPSSPLTKIQMKLTNSVISHA